MIILGLGTNLNDKLTHLRQGLKALRKIPSLSIKQISPVYISDALLPANAPAEWDQPYLNLALRCETTLTPHELLAITKQIELDLGRNPHHHWGPRPLDIDLLVWDDLIIHDDKLHIPHEHLHTRPFALWPVSDVAPHWIFPLSNQWQGQTVTTIGEQWGSKFDGNAPFRTRQILQRIDTPELMGIVNITPDSFSDGNQYIQTEQALKQIDNLIHGGADIIDLGAIATNPSAKLISAEEEWQRLEPILTTVLKNKNDFLITPKISVDTFHPQTAAKALDVGVDWINDQSGLQNQDMQDLLKDKNNDIIFMHQLGLPANKHYVLNNLNFAETIYRWADQQIDTLDKKGINASRLIFDIGIGFGKTATQSLALIQEITLFKSLPVRLLIGHSRKSFLRQFTDKQAANRDIESLPLSLYLTKNGINYLRIHDVEMCARALKVSKAFDEFI